ncbi:MAG: hypothetical protein CM15mP92_1830 [Halieaceae bacterium]|nr:MAG: hypothetical protein CM15mP92_1830 [Halieaceae bacterium]
MMWPQVRCRLMTSMKTRSHSDSHGELPDPDLCIRTAGRHASPISAVAVCLRRILVYRSPVARFRRDRIGSFPR